tara:strand:- start:405 stop:779 length:375 start_codon:yes stop_codon:yes gene_type:complete
MVSRGPAGNGLVDFQSYSGPGDRNLRSNELEGYQPVSRIGEVVINSFVDAYEFTTLKPGITFSQMSGDAVAAPGAEQVESKPMFYEWATVQPVSSLRTCISLQRATSAALLTTPFVFPFRAWSV